jgi:hypothetical protein
MNEAKDQSKTESVVAVGSKELLGRIAWNAYLASIGGKSWNGEPLPAWEQMVADEKKKAIVAAWCEVARAIIHYYTLTEIQKVVASGWAGCLPNGNIVDRRIHPTAVPMPENPHLNIPKPNAS